MMLLEPHPHEQPPLDVLPRISRTPLRWLLTVVLVSAIPSSLAAWWLDRHLAIALEGALQGIVYGLVYWSGFEFVYPWVSRTRNLRSPILSAALAQARWLLIYTVLFFVATFLVKVLLHQDHLASPATALWSYVFGLLMTSQVVSFQVTGSLASHIQELEKTKAQASFLALQAQLSPHTLFNALNTIAALIPEDPRAAEAATEQLARMLRRILDALSRPHWTLREEFQILEDLFRIEKARFGSRLTLELSLDDGEADREIPPLLLLPLVENSLKHGFRPKVGPCSLKVTARSGRIRVEDNGVGRDPGAPLGVGLRMVTERLEAAGGRLQWLPTPEGCVHEVLLCP